MSELEITFDMNPAPAFAWCARCLIKRWRNDFTNFGSCEVYYGFPCSVDYKKLPKELFLRMAFMGMQITQSNKLINNIFIRDMEWYIPFFWTKSETSDLYTLDTRRLFQYIKYKGRKGWRIDEDVLNSTNTTQDA